MASSPPSPKVAVSYAWKEEESGADAHTVDALCAEFQHQGIEFLRDKDRLKPGNSLSDFMQQIGTADFVCVFLSDAYLRSRNCMNELLIAWNKSYARSEELEKRLKVWVMPSAKIFSTAARQVYTNHWKSERDKLSAELNSNLKDASAGRRDYDELKHVTQCAQHISDILGYISDRLSAPNFEEFRAWVCAEVLPACAPAGAKASSMAVGALPLQATAPSQSESKRPLTPDEEAYLARRLREVFPKQIGHIERLLRSNEKLREDVAKSFSMLIKEDLLMRDSAALIQGIWVNFHHLFLDSTAMFVKAYDEAINKDEIVEFISSSMYLSMCPEFAASLVANADADQITVAESAQQAIADMLLCWTTDRPLNMKVPLRQTSSWEVPPEMQFEELVQELMEEFGISRTDDIGRDTLRDRLQVERDFRTPKYRAVNALSQELISKIKDPKSPLYPLLLIVRAQGSSIRPGAAEVNYDGKVDFRIERFRKLISQSA